MSAKILEAIGAGNTMTTAAEFAGIDRHTLRKWMDQGEAEAEAGNETDFSTLFTQIRGAIASAIIERVEHIRRAGEAGTWTAALAWLERRHPEDWGKPPERVEVSTPRPIRFIFQLPDGTERPLTLGGARTSLPREVD